MDLLSLNNNIVKFGSKKPLQMRVKFGNGRLSVLKADTVSFGNTDPIVTADAKMLNCIQQILNNDLQLKSDQPLIIKTNKEFLPFVKLMVQEAYKMGSGEVVIDIDEPELNKLKAAAIAKARANGEEFVDFTWKQERDKEILEERGGKVIEFNKRNSPYSRAKLTQTEIKAVIDVDKIDIPEETQKDLQIIPAEIIDDKLHLRKGQPVCISAEREHEPNVLRLAEYIYSKGAGPVEVVYTEGGRNDLVRSFYQYASEKVLKEVPKWSVNKYHEYIDKTNTAFIFLDGENPSALEGLDAEKINIHNSAMRKARKFYYESKSRPWTIYYAPTTKSAASAYPDIATKDGELGALKQAAKEAKEINRVGKTAEHVKKLQRVCDAVNKLGLKKLHFVSTDTMLNPRTGKLQPKTDLCVGITPVSIFKTAEIKTVPYNQVCVVNTPTEEVCTSPDKTMTRGHVSTTMPLSISGKIVDDIYMEFDENGKIIMDSLQASKNLDVFKKHIELNENADMLGEVALVAGSPIFDTHRVFNTTLLDENAACHIAIGYSISYCIKDADKITDPAKFKQFLAANNLNDSPTHIDFMIGGPNVTVTGVKEDGEEIVLIKDNKFQNID